MVSTPEDLLLRPPEMKHNTLTVPINKLILPTNTERASNESEEFIRSQSKGKGKEKSYDQTLVNRVGTKVATTYVTNFNMFPDDQDFERSSNENSFDKILQKQLQSSHFPAISNEDYSEFLQCNKRIWRRCCNKVRTGLVTKSKERYFGKKHLR